MPPVTLPIHVVLPDTQCRPDVPLDYLRWVGQYIVDQFAGRENVRIIHLGDHWDMPSLSHWDKGKLAMEGRRVAADIEAGNQAFAVLNQPLDDYNAKRRQFKERGWHPERHLLRGNHEDRITRAVEADAALEGFLSLDLLQSPGWEVHDYLEPVMLDGVMYAHYFYNPMTGRPFGGQVATRLKTIGRTFTQGHQQVYDHALRFVGGRSQHGLVAGTCNLQDEHYLGPQGNAYWRGIVVCHEVRDGSYDIMQVSLSYLCRRYERMELNEFMANGEFTAYEPAPR